MKSLSRGAAPTFAALLPLVLTGCGYLAAAGAGGVLGVQGGSSRKVVFASNADLVLARGPFDPGDSLEGKAAVDLVIAQFRFNATNSSTLEALTLTASGTGDDAALTNVRLVLDDDGDGQVDAGEPELAPPGTFAEDDGELRLDDLALTFTGGDSRDLLVVADLPAGAVDGQTFQVEIAGPLAVRATTTVTGKRERVPVFGAPLRSGVKQISPTGSLSLFLGPNPPADRTVFANADDEEVLQLDLRASSVEPLRVDALTLRASGSGNDGAARADLYLDVDSDGVVDPLVDLPLALNEVATGDDGAFEFTSLGQALNAREVVRWLVVLSFGAPPGDAETFRVDLGANGDVTAVGLSSSAPIAVSGAPLAGATLTVRDATLQVGPGTAVLPMPASATPGTGLVPMLQLSLTAGPAEPVTITELTIEGSGSGDESSGVQARLVRDLDGNGLIDPGSELPAFAGPLAFAADDGSLTFTGFGETIAPGATVRWLVVYDVTAASVGGDTFMATLGPPAGIVAQGATSGLDVTLTTSPASGGALTIAGSVALSGPAAGALTRFANATDVVALEAILTAGAGEAVNVTQLVLTPSGTGNDATDLAFEVYQDGGVLGTFDGGDTLRASGTFATNDQTATVALSGVTAPAGGSTRLWVVYDFNGQASDGETFRVALTPGGVSAEGASSGLPLTATGSALTGSAITVRAPTLTVALGAQSPGASTPFRTQADVEVLQARLIAGSAEAVEVSELRFEALGTLDATSGVTAIALYVDDGNGVYDGFESQLGATVVGGFDATSPASTTFTLAAGELEIPAGQGRDVLLVVSFGGTAQEGDSFSARLLATGVTAIGETSLLAVSAGGAGASGAVQTLAESEVHPSNSTVDVNPLTKQVDAGGLPITVTVKDGSGSPMAGQAVFLLATGVNDSDDIDQPVGLTGADGIATGNIDSSVDGDKTITVIVNPGPNQVVLSATPTVTFTPVVVGQEPDVLVSQAVVWRSAARALPGESDVEALQLRLTERAGTLVDIEAITLTPPQLTGAVDDVDIVALRLWRDVAPLGVRDEGDTQLGIAAFPADDSSVTFSLARAVSVPASGTLDLLVTFDLAAGIAPGADMQVGVLLPGDVELVFGASTPATPTLEGLVQGPLVTIVPAFDAPTSDTLAVAQPVVALATGELSGGGDLDYAALLANGQVEVRVGGGDGTFAAGPVLDPAGVQSGPAALALGDLDRDGLLDVVAAYATAVTVWRQDAGNPGLFLAGADTAVTGASALSDLLLLDYDRDGDLDVLVADGGGTDVFGLEGDGAGGLAGAAAIPGGFGAAPLDLAAADLDLDGELDLVVRLDGAVWVAPASGGFFAAPSVAAAVAGGAGDLLAGDLDRDATPDAATIGTGDELSVLAGGGGTVALDDQGETAPSPLTSTGARRAAFADWDRDGKLDLAVSHQGLDGLVLAPGQGRLTAPFAQPLAGEITGLVQDPGPVAVGDIDRDGDPDLLVGSTAANEVSVLLREGTGGGLGPASFRFAVRTVDSVSWALTPLGVAAGDVDLDGSPDFVLCGSDGATTHAYKVFLNAGNGSGWVAQADQALTDEPARVALADLDRDGDPDLVLSYADGTHRVEVRLGNRDGTFGAATSTVNLVGAGPRRFALGDLDRDGQLDALVVEGDLTSVRILTGTGGGFAPGAQVIVGGTPVDVALGDVNGDGALDAAVVLASGVLELYLNDGSGDLAFQDAEAIAGIGTSPTAVALGDLDGDGVLDAAVGGTGGVGVMPGSPTGFGAVADTAGPAAAELLLADTDLDGRLDLVVLTPAPGTGASIVRNASPSPGTLALGAVATQGTDPRPPYAAGALADFNGDGDLDVVGARTDATAATVHLGD